jgi:Cu+-exporting ATPase
MSVDDILVVAAAVLALAGLGWFFFGPRKARAAVLAGGVQRLEVTIKGGYSPEVIRVRQGVPVELTFDRQESGDCTSRVVFPDFRVSAALPAYQRTTVRLDPGEAGEFGFACGMNMIHGTLLVEPDVRGVVHRRPGPGVHHGASLGDRGADHRLPVRAGPGHSAVHPGGHR